MVEYASTDTVHKAKEPLNAWDKLRFRVSRLFRARIYLEEGMNRVQSLSGIDHAERLAASEIHPIACSLLSAMIEISKSLYYPPSKKQKTDDDSSLYATAHTILEGLYTLSGVSIGDVAAQPVYELQLNPEASTAYVKEKLSNLGKKTLNQITACGRRPIPELFCKIGYALLSLLDQGEQNTDKKKESKEETKVERAARLLAEDHDLLTMRRPFL